jgi:hypothetical protein
LPAAPRRPVWVRSWDAKEGAGDGVVRSTGLAFLALAACAASFFSFSLTSSSFPTLLRNLTMTSTIFLPQRVF